VILLPDGGNMKKLAFALYVASVLLVSGMMKANATTLADMAAPQYQSPVHIYEVNVGNVNTLLNIWGSIPTPCYGEPAAIMVQDEANLTVLTLHLSSAVPSGMCIQKIDEFTTQVDLATLVQSSNLSVAKDVVYLIKVSGSDFQISLPGSDLL
jgi:hypothetical protein